jgi:RNA polymerase sigma factor (sigma-70 family)
LEIASRTAPRRTERRNLPRKKLDLSRYIVRAGNLTERQRECFSLRFERGLSISEIARKMGVHNKTVYEHIEQAKKKLGLFRAQQQPRKKRSNH